MFEALQASSLARAVGESQLATAGLSAVHLVGFTLVMGSALVSNLRLAGALLVERPASETVVPSTRVLVIGLLVSAVTGSLLFLPRAASAAANGIFQIKITLLVLALAVHVMVVCRLATRPGASIVAARVAGVVGLALWAGVAVAGCAFILVE